MIRRVSIATLCCLLAPAVWAGDFYAGVGVGQASFDVDGGGASFKPDSTGYKIYGGYKPVRWLGIEAGYSDFGSFAETRNGVRLDADANAIGVWAVGILPTTPRLELFAKFGATRWDVKTALTEDGATDPSSASGNDFAYGVGIGYMVSERIGIRGEWETFKTDGEDVRFGSIGVLFKF
jgi:OOP family OmpA-OmpF porin